MKSPIALTVTYHYADLLFTTLGLGFRPVVPDHDQPALHLGRTSHHEWMFEVAFSSDDDEAVANAVSIWIVDGDCTPPGSFAHLFQACEERYTLLPKFTMSGYMCHRAHLSRGARSVWFGDCSLVELCESCRERCDGKYK